MLSGVFFKIFLFYYFFCIAGLVVVTSMAGYAMAPDAFHLSTFLLCTLGTGLQSASANAINQVRLK